MRNWTKPADSGQPETVGVLLFEQFSNQCLANAVEPLRAVNEILGRDHYRWRYLSIDTGPVASSSGLPVLPSGQLAQDPGGDYLFVLPSHGVRALATPRTLAGLRGAAARYATLVGMDTGSWLLAAAGLLDGHRATIHGFELAAFAETFDQVEVAGDRYVIDGKVVTGGGAMATFDLMLELIGRTHGDAMRLEVAAYFLSHGTTSVASAQLRRSGTALVDDCVALMSAQVETPLSIPELAEQLGTYQKRLTRAFQRQFGAPPQTVYKRLRLAAARRYAEQSGFSMAEIALRCGYQNPAAMTRAFVQEFGVPPTALRKAATH